MAERRLNTMEDVRWYVANLINGTEAGEVNLASQGGWDSWQIPVGVIEGSDLESRLKVLETGPLSN